MRKGKKGKQSADEPHGEARKAIEQLEWQTSLSLDELIEKLRSAAPEFFRDRVEPGRAVETYSREERVALLELRHRIGVALWRDGDVVRIPDSNRRAGPRGG